MNFWRSVDFQLLLSCNRTSGKKQGGTSLSLILSLPSIKSREQIHTHSVGNSVISRVRDNRVGPVIEECAVVVNCSVSPCIPDLAQIEAVGSERF
jgi:hypothetical protein